MTFPSHSLNPALGKLELGSNEIEPAHEDKQAEELDRFERRPFEIEADAAKFPTFEYGHASAAENEGGLVEYAVVEGRIVDPETLLPISFAGDLPHSRSSFTFKPDADAWREICAELGIAESFAVSGAICNREVSA